MVRYVANRIAVMSLGEIVESAPVSVFYGTPEHPYSQKLVAAAGLELPATSVDSH